MTLINKCVHSLAHEIQILTHAFMNVTTISCEFFFPYLMGAINKLLINYVFIIDLFHIFICNLMISDHMPAIRGMVGQTDAYSEPQGTLTHLEESTTVTPLCISLEMPIIAQPHLINRKCMTSDMPTNGCGIARIFTQNLQNAGKILLCCAIVVL